MYALSTAFQNVLLRFAIYAISDSLYGTSATKGNAWQTPVGYLKTKPSPNFFPLKVGQY